MTKKIMKRSLALSALMAFVITGSAMAAELTDVSVVRDSSSGEISSLYGIDTKNYEEAVTFKGDTLSISMTNNKASNESFGFVDLPSYYNHVLGETGITKKIEVNATAVQAVRGIDLGNYGGGGSLTINADELVVKAHSAENMSRALNLRSGYNLTINTGKTTLIATSGENGLGLGIGAFSGSNLNVKGDLKIVADYAIAVSGGSTVKINEKGDSSVQIEGLVSFHRTGSTEVDSALLLNLSGKDSYFKGNIIAEDDRYDNPTSKVSGMTLCLSDGATWNLTGASTVTNVTFGKDSLLNIKGEDFEASKKVYALNASGGTTSLKVEQGAKLAIEGIEKDVTYNIAKGFGVEAGVGENWTIDNNLMTGEWSVTDDGLQVTTVAKEAETIAEDLGVSESTGEFLGDLADGAREAIADGVKENDGSAKGKLVGLVKAAANSQNPVVVAKATEVVRKMAEAGGNSATAANVVNNVTNVTGQRLSFSGGNHGGNKGGHGVGLLEEGSGAAIWAQYVHGKDSVENMPSDAGASSYEGQYNGIVMGVDFKKVGKFQSGIAFNYGEGDTNSVNTTSPTRSEYDFWGIGYYGNIRNADSNVIFDIGYAKTDSDVTSNVVIDGYNETYEASPETTTWTAGVKVEKLYQNNNVQVVPYTGLRYMSIDPEDYSTKCGAMGYKMERQDIWLLPVGVSIKQEIVNPNGWVVTPKVDLSYIWAFGDTDSTMETNTVLGTENRPVGYDVMDDGSWMGLVGVEAAMDDWTFGVSYSYQKGDHSESKKWYVDAKYSF